MALLACSFLYSAGIKRLFHKKKFTQGDASCIPFSKVEAISAYIPEIESNVFAFPLLACRISEENERLLEWNDPYRPHSFYDLTRDAEALVGKEKIAPNAFSKLKSWFIDSDDPVIAQSYM